MRALRCAKMVRVCTEKGLIWQKRGAIRDGR